MLRRGEALSIVALARRIKELLGITVSESTVGVLLHRGLAIGEYTKDGSIWSMVLDQNKGQQQPEEPLISNNEQESTDDDAHPLLGAMRMEDFANNV